MSTDASGNRVMAGIGLGMIAYSFFSMHDAANKWLVGGLPVWQVLFFRSCTVVLACLVFGRGRLLARAIETPLKLALMLRGLLTLTAWLLYYTAARSMSLAQLMTLYYSSPLMTALLAVPMLGERVTKSRWMSLGLGFTGVLVASDPFGVRATVATGLVLAAAALWGYAIILMRQIARRESTLLQMLSQNLCFLVCTSVMTALTWVTPTPLQLALLLGIGVFGGLGQFILFEAVRLAPASVMATVEYTGLLWAFGLGYLVWGDVPSLSIVAGAALILTSGILLLVMERRAER